MRCRIARSASTFAIEPDLVVADHDLRIRHARRGGQKRIDERNEILGDMDVRIIPDAVGQEFAAIKTFEIETVKADPAVRARKSGQKRRKA